MKRSCQRAFFGLVFKYFTIFFLVLICCSFSTKQTSEVEQRRSYITARKPSLKRLGLQIQYPTCLTNLENADENDMTKRSRLKEPQVNVLKKDFHSPDAGKRTWYAMIFFSSFPISFKYLPFSSRINKETKLEFWFSVRSADTIPRGYSGFTISGALDF